MKRGIWITLLAILAFAAILIARLPVRWVTGFIPKNVTCGEWAGTVWNGSCTGFSAQNVQLDSVAWELKALPLLRGKVSAYVDNMRGTNYARGDVEASTSGKTITARNFQADLPLDHNLIPQVPRNLTGNVRANLQSIHVENQVIQSVQGQLEAHNLVQVSNGQRMVLGDYSLTFPAADASAEPVGQLRSLSGPLTVEGTLKLTREPGFDLQGLVAAGPEAAPQLAKELAYLGTPDAQGRRPFAVAATF